MRKFCQLFTLLTEIIPGFILYMVSPLPILEFIMTLFFQFLILFTDDAIRYGGTFEEFCKS